MNGLQRETTLTVERFLAWEDRQEKRSEYIGLPSLQQYVMVDRTRPLVTLVERSGGVWSEPAITEGSVPLPSFSITLPMQAIYASIRFA